MSSEEPEKIQSIIQREEKTSLKSIDSDISMPKFQKEEKLIILNAMEI